MRINRDVAGVFAAESGFRRAVLQEGARHPVVLPCPGEILDSLTEVAAVEFRSTLARRADEDNREPGVEGHRDQGRFAIARHTIDPNLLCVYGWIRFEIVESAGRAPGPGAKRSPIVGLAALALIHE